MRSTLTTGVLRIASISVMAGDTTSGGTTPVALARTVICHAAIHVRRNAAGAVRCDTR